MGRARWRNRVGPPSSLLGLALLLAAAITASAAIAAAKGRSPALAGQCPASPAEAARAAQRGSPQPSISTTTEQSLTPRGELTGSVLRIARNGIPGVAIALPVESSVGPRSGDAMVYTRAGGGRDSEVHLVDVLTGCDTIIARPSAIVRSAIMSADGSAVFVHSVARGSRRDAGVLRHDLATGTVTAALPALDPPRRLGRIHGTEMRWSLGGDALTVQSCGFAECVTRIVEMATGRLITVDQAGQGALIGTTSSRLITYGACPGLPCAVLAFDLESGAAELLGEARGASLSLGRDGRARLSMMTADGSLEVVP